MYFIHVLTSSFLFHSGDPEHNIAPVVIPHEPLESALKPYESISAKYRDELDEDLYWRPEDMSHPFR
jgi:hypothetical protein